MGQQIELKEGLLPWDPPHADHVEILQRFGIPLAGLIRQFGETYLFWCLEGESTPGNLWGYVSLRSEEEDLPRAVSPEKAFSQLVEDGRQFIVALNVEGQGIITWKPLELINESLPIQDAAHQALGITEEQLEIA